MVSGTEIKKKILSKRLGDSLYVQIFSGEDGDFFDYFIFNIFDAQFRFDRF
jgi:hypothetical protein